MSMSKIWVEDECVVRTVIEPGMWIGVQDGSDRWVQLMRDRGESLARTIRTLENAGGVSVDVSRKAICSFCRRAWEIDENGVPACCDEAIQETA